MILFIGTTMFGIIFFFFHYSMYDLQERLRANELRQQLIEEQLQSLDDECDTANSI